MTPFNLNAAKENAPLVTRDGDPATFIAHVPDARSDSQVLCLVYDSIFLYSTTGNFTKGKSALDLFMANSKRTVWVNLYQKSYGLAYFYDDEKEADRSASTDSARIGGKAWPLEIEG